MGFGIVLLTLAAYGLATWLWLNERTPNFLLALVAGHLSALPSPLWQALYRFSYDERFTPLLTLVGRPLPLIIFVAAWTIMLPPLIVFYLYRHDWWLPSYTSGLLTFVMFVFYHWLIETIGMRAGWWRFDAATQLPLGLPMALFSALMNALIGLGALSTLILTQRYAWLSLLMVLVPMPVALSLFVNGLLGAPLYTALLLRNNLLLDAESWAGAIGAVGTLGLLLWGAHMVASVIAGQRLPNRRSA